MKKAIASKVVVPRLRSARKSSHVAMPRFRKTETANPGLTEVVSRVLARALSNPAPFALFVVDGKPLLSNLKSEHFKRLQRRWPEQMIATYGPGVKVLDVVDDLSGILTDHDLSGEVSP